MRRDHEKITGMINKHLALFDSHLHIIDKRFPLVENNGYMPGEFTCEDYLNQLLSYNLVGGAIVSGSFQAFDQSYLLAALCTLGSHYVGVTQLPVSISDKEIINLDKAGVRALRFNIKRGGSEQVNYLSTMANKVYDMVGWHTELHIDSSNLDSLYSTIMDLPAMSIDHLGLSQAGFKTLLSLVEKGVKVKATGFGRVDFDVSLAIKDIYSANPDALMFGTDLPSTRAPKPYDDRHFNLIADILDDKAAKKVLSTNALQFYKSVAS